MATLVNTVNCVGVMGAGIALEHRLRDPEMFARYKEMCDQSLLTPGKLWLWKKSQKWVLNFPTKVDWKQPSKLQYIEEGLEKFVATYKERGITSIAFPLLGAQNGGIDEDLAMGVMVSHLTKCDIPIEIYKFKLDAPDSLLIALRNKVSELSIKEFADRCKVKTNTASLLLEYLYSDEFKMISQLRLVKGIGITTIERLYVLAMNSQDDEPGQKVLI